MPSACKFYPSCSHYAVEAVRLHGARQGSWLALRRVLRCHPFSGGGVDLVPDPADFAHAETRAGCSSTGFSLWGFGAAGEKKPQAEACATKHADVTVPVVIPSAARNLLFEDPNGKADSSGATRPRNDNLEACVTEVRS